MFAFIVSYGFFMFFFCFFLYIFDIDSLAVFLNHLNLIVSDSGRRKRTCCLIKYFMDKPSLLMIIMTGLIIAIKDSGFLALASIAAPIYVLHIGMCRKVPLLRYGSLTL